MILGFKQEINGKPTYFIEKILSGVGFDYINKYAPKKHSIRSGNRWIAGKTIHMAINVRTKKYIQFNKKIHELSKCISTQKIEIQYSSDRCSYSYQIHDYDKKGNSFTRYVRVMIDGRFIPYEVIKDIAVNDGFDNTLDFFAWFNKPFKGQIIHWTDLKY